jgi:hypothetical protein
LEAEVLAMSANEYVDNCLRIQSALVGSVTPSLLSVSFQVQEGRSYVRLVYSEGSSVAELATIRHLENRIIALFAGEVKVEIVFQRDSELFVTLEHPIFRIRSLKDSKIA